MKDRLKRKWCGRLTSTKLFCGRGHKTIATVMIGEWKGILRGDSVGSITRKVLKVYML